ncbi:MAG: ABC transporter permease [Bacteroidota bacterium]
MIQSYLKIALRHLSRNRTYVLINMIGMGVAIAWCILAFVNYQFVANADTEFTNSERIYRLIKLTEGNGAYGGRVEGALLDAAVRNIGEVESGTRYTYEGGTVKYGDKLFLEDLRCVDPNYLDIFDKAVLKGDRTALSDPSKVVITASAAERYFGEADPIGKVLTIWPGKPWKTNLAVGAVIEDVPENACMKFSLLTNFSFVEKGERRDSLDRWDRTVEAIFLVLKDGADQEAVAESMKQFLPQQHESNPDWKTLKYILQPLNEVYKNEPRINNNSLSQAMPSVAVWGLGIIALLILLTACLNFTNTTISFSNKRLKEMGVRKVMGGGRWQLVNQLMGESFILCLGALLIGVLLSQVMVAWYNSLWEYANLELALNWGSNAGLWIFLIATLFVSTLLGGAYPALYISSFNPTSIFRGSSKFGGDNWMVKSLLGLQIVIALVTIVGSITFAQNIEFQKNMDPGYTMEGMINVRIEGEEHYEIFASQIKKNPDILGVAGATNNLGFGSWWNRVGKLEDGIGTQVQLVGENFIEVMDFELLQGRSFNEEIDIDKSVIVNESFLKRMQGKAELDGTIDMYDKKFTIVGVVRDFMSASYFEGINPNVFHLKSPEDYRYLKVKTVPGQLTAVNEYLQKTWKANFPLIPFRSFYQDEVRQDTLTVSKNVSRLFLILSLVTLLLSSTGLFALISLNLLKRAKEIAIRKVLGASAKSISLTINRDYVILFLIGGIIGGLAGGYFAYILLDSIFTVYDGVSIPAVVLSVLFVIAVGVLTVGGRMWSVLRSNPAEVLKSE